MREYMITVIGGAVLAALAHTVSPEKWTKYIKTVTGIMIVSIILSPVSALLGGDIFEGFEMSTFDGYMLQQKEVNSVLAKTLSEDIVRRIKAEIGEDITAEVTLLLNGELQIEGVDEVKVWNGTNRENIRKVISQTYSPQKISFQD